MTVQSRKQEKEVELQPDAWARFERAVDAAIKSGPQHRATKKKRAKTIKSRKKRQR